jgi:hypothetical protein
MTKDSLRLIVNLGKYQVTSISRGAIGTKFTLALPKNVKLTADMPVSADVRIGDMLTLYTEVLVDDELPTKEGVN